MVNRRFAVIVAVMLVALVVMLYGLWVGMRHAATGPVGHGQHQEGR